MSGAVGRVEVATVGALAATAFTWRRSGGTFLTVVAKAGFHLVHDGVMAPGPAPAVLVDDVHHGDSPTKSVREPSDYIPYRRKCDVLLVGHAHAPGAAPVSEMTARLAIEQGGTTLVDKRIRVVGDRASNDAPGKPFAEMSLSYERSYGGIGFAGNPLGVGLRGQPKLPNLVHENPERAQRSVGFGPIAASWPARKRIGAGFSMRSLAKGTVDIPVDAADGFFQAAPPDQQVPEIRGDETLILEGLSAERTHLSTQLPASHVLSVIQRDGGVPRDVPMRIDTLFVDADRQICRVSWRGTVQLESESEVDHLAVAATIAVRGKRVGLEAVAQALERSRALRDGSAQALTSPSPSPSARGLEGTVVLREPTSPPPTLAVTNPASPTDSSKTLPFEPTASTEDGTRDSAVATPIPGAPWAPPAAEVAPASPDLASTMGLSEGAERSATKPEPPAPVPEPPAPVPEPPAPEPPAPEPPAPEPPVPEPPKRAPKASIKSKLYGRIKRSR